MVGLGRVQPGEHLGLYFFEAGQGLLCRSQVVGQLFFQRDGVAHFSRLQFFDARNDVSHFTGLQCVARLVGRREHAQVIGVVDRTGGHHLETLTFIQVPVDHTHQHDHAHIGVEPTVNNHGAQRCVRVAFGGRDFGDHGFENLFHAHTGFGRARDGIAGINANHVFYFRFGVLRVSRSQVHFVEHWQHLDTQVERGVTVGNGLRFHALAGIHHQ